MNRFSLVALATASTLALSACEKITYVCAGVGYNALMVNIRDAAGRGQAFGAAVTLYDGTYVERDSATDTLNIFAASERGGRTYDIQVTKQYYNDAWVRGVRAPGGGCVSGGVTALEVPVRLSLVTGAPPIRTFVLLPGGVLLDRAPYTRTFAFTPWLDANPGIPRGVRWQLSGDTASVSFDPATGALTYRCLPTSGYLTLKATAQADTTFVASARIAVQGHPAASNDPPCS